MNDGRSSILLVLAGLLGVIGALIMSADSALVTAISWGCIGSAAILIAIAVVLPRIAPPRFDKSPDASTPPAHKHEPVGLRH